MSLSEKTCGHTVIEMETSRQKVPSGVRTFSDEQLSERGVALRYSKKKRCLLAVVSDVRRRTALEKTRQLEHYKLMNERDFQSSPMMHCRYDERTIRLIKISCTCFVLKHATDKF